MTTAPRPGRPIRQLKHSVPEIGSGTRYFLSAEPGTLIAPRHIRCKSTVDPSRRTAGRACPRLAPAPEQCMDVTTCKAFLPCITRYGASILRTQARRRFPSMVRPHHTWFSHLVMHSMSPTKAAPGIEVPRLHAASNCGVQPGRPHTPFLHLNRQHWLVLVKQSATHNRRSTSLHSSCEQSSHNICNQRPIPGSVP